MDYISKYEEYVSLRAKLKEIRKAYDRDSAGKIERATVESRNEDLKEILQMLKEEEPIYKRVRELESDKNFMRFYMKHRLGEMEFPK